MTSSLDREPTFRIPLSTRRPLRISILAWLAFGLLIAGVAPVRAVDLETNRLLQSHVAKDWVTNGGNLTNQRYSTLKQIDTTNVKQLKGA
jgi:alcohol dehydrogenase (cytochrome c)